MGKVRDFLFDDAAWRIRWLVVHTGPWLGGRIALVHVSDIGQADHNSHALAVRLTRAQVEASPDILLDEPISRQIEYGLHGFIGWDPAWGNPRYVAGPLSGLGIQVSQARLDEEKAMHKAPRGGGQFDQGDPHLRSVAAVIGNQVCATDGLVGHIQDILAEGLGWAVAKIVVNTAVWWSEGRDVMISPLAVAEIS